MPNAKNAVQYMTVKEASQLWGYREDTIRKWCRNGKILKVVSAEKQGGRWQIPKDAVCPAVRRRTKDKK